MRCLDVEQGRGVLAARSHQIAIHDNACYKWNAEVGTQAVTQPEYRRDHGAQLHQPDYDSYSL